MMKFHNEIKLVRNLKTGNEESFSYLYDKYGSDIYNLAYRMLGSKEDAEDMTQETFVQAYRKIGNFKEKSQLYTWLYSIARNLCYRFLQNRRRDSFIDLETLIYSVHGQEVHGQNTDPERQFYISQVREGCLTGLLRCLSMYQRVAFILKVLLGLTIKEVADIIDKSEGATKVLIHRAKQNLKIFLCKNCSFYDTSNPCRCENLIDFSLKQGWIEKPSVDKLEGFEIIDSTLIENEISSIRKITVLYKSLPERKPPEELRKQIQDIIRSQRLVIFKHSKV